MQVQQVNQSPTFTSLRMPSNLKIARKAGTRVAEAAQIARPKLEYLAENVDLHVMPYRLNSRDRGLALTATKPSNNPIKNFFTRLNIKYNVIMAHLDCGCSSLVEMAPLTALSGKINTAEEIAELTNILAEFFLVHLI